MLKKYTSAQDEQRMLRSKLLHDFELDSFVSLNEFSGQYSADKIKGDVGFVKGHNEVISRRTKRLSPSRLTTLLTIGGLSENDWLDLAKSKCTTNAFVASDYDSINYHADGIGSVHFSEPVLDPETRLSFQRIFFAFETATSSDPERLLARLSCTVKNDTPALPFGFTRPEYVKSGRWPVGAVMMPRYFISAGYESATRLGQLIIQPPPGRRAPFKYRVPQALIVRFRVLYLMWIQNALYQAMLPDERGSKLLKEADFVTAKMDEILRQAVDKTIAEIEDQRLLPEQQQQELAKLRQRGHSAQAIRKLILDWQLQQAESQFRSYAREYRLSVRPGNGDTFVKLAKLIDQLTDLVYDGKLDGYREPSSRAIALPAELLKGLK